MRSMPFGTRRWTGCAVLAEFDPFKSTHFVWSDIGCFRDSLYANTHTLKELRHFQDETRMTFVNIRPFVAAEDMSARFDVCDGTCRRIAAAQFVAPKAAALHIPHVYSLVVRTMYEHGSFIGDDQNNIAVMCVLYRSLCSFITPDVQYGDAWFGLQPVLVGRRQAEIFTLNLPPRDMTLPFHARDTVNSSSHDPKHQKQHQK
jgi:hypothetical protein